jgi:hypothetical protein
VVRFSARVQREDCWSLVQWAWRQADLSPLSSAGIKSEWSHASASLHACVVCIVFINQCLVTGHSAVCIAGVVQQAIPACLPACPPASTPYSSCIQLLYTVAVYSLHRKQLPLLYGQPLNHKYSYGLLNYACSLCDCTVHCNDD